MSEVKTNKISSLASNNDITLDPDGTGDVVVAQVASSSLDIKGDRTDAQIFLKGGSAGAGIQLFGSTYTNYAGAMYLDATASTTGTNDAQIVFRTGSTPSEAMRIDRDGDLGIGSSPGNIRFRVSNTENKITQFLHASNGSYTDQVLEIETVKAGASDFNFALWRTNNGGDLEFKVRGDGQVSADGSFSGGGADYAEYFEWSDGNSSSEDRRGYSVVLDGNKVRKATSDDAAASIIGIVSAHPAVVGDSRWNKWHGKHETDDYGTVVRETCSLVTWTEAPADETGAPVTHTYYTDRVPDGITVPSDAVVTSNQTRPKESSDYDASVTYIPREERKEWDAIGLMGKLRLRKGQPTGDRWIKLRDISSDVEEWLVR